MRAHPRAGIVAAMRHRRALALLIAALAAAAATAPAAQAGRLIAPLDVTAVAEVRPDTVLQGSWILDGPDTGWVGENLKVVESWKPGVTRPLRIRGRAEGGPTRTHYVKTGYLRQRTAQGVLAEKLPEGDGTQPLELRCAPSGFSEPGETFTDGAQVALRVVDEPAKDRVTIYGPPITFLGPTCRRAGHELPVRTVGLHPPNRRQPWVPAGALTPWQVTVPRAEFAAGGTFRFRGRYSYAHRIEQYTSLDLAGTGMTHGRVAVDLRVRRNGR